MSYRGSVYQKALNTLEKRRERAEAQANAKFMQISEKIPQLESIQKELAAIGLSISKLFFYDGDNGAEFERLKRKSLELQNKKKELLVKNGFDENSLTVKYTCPICCDTGYVNNRICKCHRQLLLEAQRGELEKAAPLGKCTFETFDLNYYPAGAGENAVSPRLRAEKIYEYCRQYAATLGAHAKNLLLFGGTGLGKTHLSLAIANVAVNRGLSVIFGTCQNILSDLENEKFGRAVKRYDEEGVLYCDLLIIDDLGTEFQSSYTTACLYNIINTRLLTSKPTVINTNCEFAQLEGLYGERVTSRLAGEYDFQTLEGSDIRYLRK
ncbi:MAG: ATP-binding protein [Clostridiales bacterium]|nr:ATP-binding protein [Clostridiales bacterium]